MLSFVHPAGEIDHLVLLVHQIIGAFLPSQHIRLDGVCFVYKVGDPQVVGPPSSWSISRAVLTELVGRASRGNHGGSCGCASHWWCSIWIWLSARGDQ